MLTPGGSIGVRITLPRKLQTATLFGYTSAPTIDSVMYGVNETPMPYFGSFDQREDLKPPGGKTARATLDARIRKTAGAATGASKKGARTWKAALSPDAKC